MEWWILKDLTHDRRRFSLSVIAKSNKEAWLWMLWSTHPPSRTPIYRIVRGKRVFCGYKYKWDTPNITHQIEYRATHVHHFGPISLSSTDHVWYYLSSYPIPGVRFCQSALFHVYPPEAHTWTTKAYVGTNLKGIFYTDSFTGPGGAHPVWSPRNQGLHSWDIHQLEPDPFGLAYRIYALAGVPGNRILYERLDFVLPLWIPLLTIAQAITLTGSAAGTLCWVSTNPYFPGSIYVLFNSALGDNGTWCIRSLDYGDTWTARLIFPGAINRDAGNITSGLAQGTSPYDPGTTLYAALCTGLMAGAEIWLSTDHGRTWLLNGWEGTGLLTPRCHVDPTDQSIVYIGADRNIANPHELWRSENHGAGLVEVDGPYHLAPMLTPFVANMWVHPYDHELITLIESRHVYTSQDYCLTWTDHGLMDHTAHRLAILWENPDRLYLARYTSAPAPPHIEGPHVLYVTEDYGATMYGKAGAFAALPDGGGNSIPWNCGGLCAQGMQLFPPY